MNYLDTITWKEINETPEILGGILSVNTDVMKELVSVIKKSNATNFIVDQAKKENMGGRPIERIVNKIVANELVDMILFDNLSNCNVLLELVDNQVKAIKQDSLAKKSTNPKRKTTKKAPKMKEALKQLQLDLSLDNQE